MRIAFFTENEFTGKVNRANAGRTDTSWMVALNADHHPLSLVVQQKYDLGIIIVPKKNPTAAFTFFKHFTHLCEKWGTMQEANQTYWQNGTLHEQFGYLNFLDACDVIFCHNERDAKYFRGLFPGKKVEVMQSVLIEDALPTNITDSSNRTGAMIGGNWTEWYSGQDSYFIAQEFNEQIYAPSMGRKHHNEDDLEEINYLPYLNWTQWIEELSKRKYA
ncbi:MAG: hypothetical protein EB127_27150, partial [Alphaproteobacteria bacterium]|nr:hypothetical protein [Alphaproteobacteria bacterium]